MYLPKTSNSIIKSFEIPFIDSNRSIVGILKVSNVREVHF